MLSSKFSKRGGDVVAKRRKGAFEFMQVGVALFLLAASSALWAMEEGLQKLFEAVEASHPQIKAARHNYDAALRDIEATKRRRWPSISTTVESDTGNRYSAPTQTLQIEQKLWDKGQLSAQIEEAQAVANASNVTVGLERQRIFLEVVSAWQGYLSADARRVIALDMTSRLGEYKEMMRRRVQAEVSPPIDLEVVESRLLQTSVERVQALSAMRTAMAKLVQLSGLTEQAILALSGRPVPDVLDVKDVESCVTTQCWRSGLESHPLVIKAKWDVQALEKRLKSKESESWPDAYLRLTQPVDMGTGLANQTNMRGSVFVGLRYAPGAGFETAVQARSLVSRLASAKEAVDASVREVAVALESDATDLLSSKSRFVSQQQAVKSSVTVLDSYTSQFVAARKTWLDLLNAVRELAQNQYAMVEAQVSMAAAMYRFEIRSGRLKDLP